MKYFNLLFVVVGIILAYIKPKLLCLRKVSFLLTQSKEDVLDTNERLLNSAKAIQGFTLCGMNLY